MLFKNGQVAGTRIGITLAVDRAIAFRPAADAGSTGEHA
jgi:hypothetical protein